MNAKTIKALEYKKIINMIGERTESELGRKRVEEIRPLTDIKEIKHLQDQTEEALSLIIKKGVPQIGRAHV